MSAIMDSEVVVRLSETRALGASALIVGISLRCNSQLQHSRIGVTREPEENAST